MKKKYYIFIILSILILVQSRIIPHPHNFTPILAAGIFSGFYFKNFFLSFFILIASMFLGDLYLGFHNTMIFTYLSLIIPVYIGIQVKELGNVQVILSGFLSSLAFFLITNFGAWVTLDFYEKNFQGLLNSYVLAIPFFHNTILSTIFYLFLFKWLNTLAKKYFKIA